MFKSLTLLALFAILQTACVPRHLGLPCEDVKTLSDIPGPSPLSAHRINDDNVVSLINQDMVKLYRAVLDCTTPKQGCEIMTEFNNRAINLRKIQISEFRHDIDKEIRNLRNTCSTKPVLKVPLTSDGA